jgi:DNA-binding XRE family transcriptional regulator
MAHVLLSGAKVRERREHLGLTQDELRQRIGIGRVTLWRIETESHANGCQFVVADALARALDVPLEALLP